MSIPLSFDNTSGYIDLLFKKYLGVTESNTNTSFSQEAAGNSRPLVFANSQLFSQPIPLKAPSGPNEVGPSSSQPFLTNTDLPVDLLFTGYVQPNGTIGISDQSPSLGTVYTSNTYPWIQFIQNLRLSPVVSGFSYRFVNPGVPGNINLLSNLIPFNYDPVNNSYTTYLYTSFGSYYGSTLVNQQFYVIDTDAGYLIFPKNDWANGSPLISFYRYNGAIGIPTNLGSLAGAYNQNVNALAYGSGAGQYAQGTGSVAIGFQAGQTGQGQYSIAIGSFAGPSGMTSNTIVLNASGTGLNTSGPTGGFYVNPIASYSGSTGPFNLLAYGRDNQVVQITGSVLSALTNTSNISVLPGLIDIGVGAGSVGQGINAMAIGDGAGQFHQATGAIAIGFQAGQYSQGTGTIGAALAIGYQAGVTGQNTNTVAVGFQAGNLNQGTGSIAVGYQAGSIVPSSVSGSTGSAYLTSGNFPLSLSMYSANTFSSSNTISSISLPLTGSNTFTLGNTSVVPGMITSNIGTSTATANIVLQNASSTIIVNTTTKTGNLSGTFTYPSKIVMSANGQYQLGSIGNTVYLSTNSGITFRPTTLSTTNLWTSIAMSGNGQYMIAYSINTTSGTTTGSISLNYGSSWSPINTNAGLGISSVAISYTGQYIITVGGFVTGALNNFVNVSSNFGSTFSRSTLPSSRWVTCSMSSSGQYMLVGSTTTMYLSTNFGLTFSIISSLPTLVGITSTPVCWYTSYVSGNGQCMIAVTSTYVYYISTNYGATWVLGTFTIESSQLPYFISLTNTSQFLVAINPILSKSTIYLSPSYKTLPTTTFDFGGTGNGGTGRTIQLLSLPPTSTITSTAISSDGTYLTLATTTGFYTVNMNSAGNSVALGYQAGQINQAINTVAIGSFAGQINQHANTIVLNASGSGLNTSTNGGLFAAPINPSSLATSAGVGLLGYSSSDSQIVTVPAMFDSSSDIITLGNYAGSVTGTTNNSIILNASGTGVGGNGPTGGFYVAPIGSSIGSTGPFTLLAYGSDRQIVSITGTALTALGIGGGGGGTVSFGPTIQLGTSAGSSNQANGSIAIGFQAGQYNQGSGLTGGSIAIGYQAGVTGQNSGDIAIGFQAGQSSTLPSTGGTGSNILSWTSKSTTSNVSSVAMSGDGKYQIAVTCTTPTYYYTQNGNTASPTWITGTLPGNARFVGMSNDGSTVVATYTSVGVINPQQSSLTSNSWTINGVTFTASASTEHPVLKAPDIFNNRINNTTTTNTTPGSRYAWASSTASYTNGNPPTGPNTTTSGLNGEWVQIQTSVPLVMHSYQLAAGGLNTQLPKNFTIFGSNDNQNWKMIQSCATTSTTAPISNLTIIPNIIYTQQLSIINQTLGSNTLVTSPGAATSSYTYFRLVVQNTFVSSGTSYAEIGQWLINFYNPIFGCYSINFNTSTPTFLNLTSTSFPLSVSNQSISMTTSPVNGIYYTLALSPSTSTICGGLYLIRVSSSSSPDVSLLTFQGTTSMMPSTTTTGIPLSLSVTDLYWLFSNYCCISAPYIAGSTVGGITNLLRPVPAYAGISTAIDSTGKFAVVLLYSTNDTGINSGIFYTGNNYIISSQSFWISPNPINSSLVTPISQKVYSCCAMNANFATGPSIILVGTAGSIGSGLWISGSSTSTPTVTTSTSTVITFTQITSLPTSVQWVDVVISPSGQYMYAACAPLSETLNSNNGSLSIYYSNNYGVNGSWSLVYTPITITNVLQDTYMALTNDGTRLLLGSWNTNSSIYNGAVSTSNSLVLPTTTNVPVGGITSSCISSDGNYNLVVSNTTCTIFIYMNNTLRYIRYTDSSSQNTPMYTSISSNGCYMLISWIKGVSLSSNYGFTWSDGSTQPVTSIPIFANLVCTNVYVSPSGQNMYVSTGSLIYNSSDYGVTWSMSKSIGTSGSTSLFSYLNFENNIIDQASGLSFNIGSTLLSFQGVPPSYNSTTVKIGTYSAMFNNTAGGTPINYISRTNAINGNNGDFSISLWINIQNVTSSNMIPMMVSFGGANIYILIDTTTNTLKYIVNIPSASFLNIATMLFGFNYKQWYHIVLSVNISNNKVFGYVNGYPVGSITLPTLATYSTPTICIGSGTSLNLAYNGLIDDFRVYNGVLTSVDVFSLYNNGSSVPGTIISNLSLVCYLPFENNIYDYVATYYNSSIVKIGSTSLNLSGNLTNTASGSGGFLTTTYTPPSSVSFSIWFYVTSYLNTNNMTILSLSVSANNGIIVYIGASSTSTASLFLFYNTLFYNTFNSAVVSLGPSDLNKWNHVCLTLNNSNSRPTTLYFNGNAIHCTSIVNVTGITNLYIGYNAIASMFSGYLDDFRIYNGVLSPAQVWMIYNNTMTPTSSSPLYLQTNSYPCYNPQLPLLQNPTLSQTQINPVVTQNSGLIAWFDASTLGLTDGVNVTSWQSRSSGYTFSSTGTVSPVYRTNNINGLGCVNLVGANCTMSIPSFSIGQIMSVFMVSQSLSTSTQNYQNGPFLEQGLNAISGKGFYLYPAGGAPFAIHNGSTSIGTGPTYTAIPVNTISIDAGINPDPSNTNYITYYKNGTASSSTSSISTTTTTIDTLYLNNRLQNAANIAEIMIFNIALTASQRREVEGYLAVKWGISSLLPITHPYYTGNYSIGQLQYIMSSAFSTSLNYQLCVYSGSMIQVSSYGTNFTTIPSSVMTASKAFSAVSSSGQYMIVCIVTALSSTGPVYYSSDFGSTWSQIQSTLLSSGTWTGCSISSDGSYINITDGSTVYTINSNISINSVAIGYQAGQQNQGQYSIAIGNGAGQINQPANSIVMNATSSSLNGIATVSNGCFIAPIASSTNSSSTSLSFLGYGSDNQVVQLSAILDYNYGLGLLNNKGFYVGSKTDNYTISGYSYSHYSISWASVSGFINTDVSPKCFISGWAGMSLITGGVSRLVIDSNGKVGIGITNPGSNLSVTNDIGIMSGTVAYLRLVADSGAANYIQSSSTINSGRVPLHFTGNLASGSYVTIDANGNLGVNTSTPSYRLDVNGDTRVTGSVIATSFAGSAVDKLFNNMGSNHGSISSFDATSPSYGFGFRFVFGSNGPGSSGNGANQFYTWYTGLGNEYPATGAGSYGAMFAVERVSTNPYLHVRYNENNSLGSWRKISAGYADSAYMVNGGGTGQSTGIILTGMGTNNIYCGSSDAFNPRGENNLMIRSWYGIGFLSYDNIVRGGIDTRTGNIAFLGTATFGGDVTAFGSVSDVRLKKNIIPFHSTLNIINSLNPVTFTWKEDIYNEKYQNKDDVGFIAQEIEKVIPLAVGEFEINDTTFKKIKHERIIPYIVKSIQELSEKNQMLEQENISLLQKVNETNDLLHQLINKLDIQI